MFGASPVNSKGKVKGNPDGFKLESILTNIVNPKSPAPNNIAGKANGKLVSSLPEST